MKKVVYNNILIGFLILLSTSVSAQLTETSLDNNNQLQYHKKNILQKNVLVVDTLELPFYDDFAQNSIYPTSNFWLDSNVFVNNSYADTPIFKGVSTFDCLDKNGLMYSHANSFTFIADTLVSKPINLAYTPSDNVVISFFVQPQGLAYDKPEKRDSLVLKIKAPGANWKSVWNMEGEFNKPFEQVFIPITDTAYLKKGFQMQFMNYASVSSDNRSSNGDYWNLDLVYIDTGRTVNDTIIQDVGFVTVPKSYIKDYYSMPCTHMASIYDAKSNNQSYRNYGDSTIGFDRILYFYVENHSESRGIGGTVDLQAHKFHSHSFIYSTTIFDYHFFQGDTSEYVIKSVLHLNSGVPEVFRQNDTAYFNQNFYNYYALDDGIPEAGIGIDGNGSAGGMVAVKFYTVKPDTLRSIRFWFNRTNSDATLDLAFDMIVWENNNGIPGDVIYKEENLFTKYSYGLDNYVDYMLETPFLLSDTFFIGFKQNHENYLNLGFDKNYDNSDRTFYNFGSWQQSANVGSIMIRPVFGSKFSIGINDVKNSLTDINIYPNPAKNIVNIDYDKECTINVYNQTGSLVRNYSNTKVIDVSDFADGLYFFNIHTNKSSVTKKIIINK